MRILFTAAALVLSLEASWAQFKVALLLDRGGKDDKSFNTSAYEGATRARDKLGIVLKYVEAPDNNAYESLLRGFGQRGYDLIICIGFAQKEALAKAAPGFPRTRFAIVDAQVDAPNVRSLLLRGARRRLPGRRYRRDDEQDGQDRIYRRPGYPADPAIRAGYEAGAKSVNPRVTVLANYVGMTGAAWNNPPKGKELAVSQYDAGADVIFAAAGASGLGVFDAAEDKRKFVIGVDANQDGVKPGLVLTSMLKRIDEAVYVTIAEAKAGTFTGGVKRFGLANKGIDYSRDRYNADILTEPVRKRADQIKAGIIAGKIVVPDYYTKK